MMNLQKVYWSIEYIGVLELFFLYPAAFGGACGSGRNKKHYDHTPYSPYCQTSYRQKHITKLSYFSWMFSNIYILFYNIFVIFSVIFKHFLYGIYGCLILTNRGVCGIWGYGDRGFGGLTLRTLLSKMRHTPLLSTFLHK